MLLTKSVLERIVSGEISVVYRRWQKPTVKQNGRLRTMVGELAIGHVVIVDPVSITDMDAAAAGWSSAAELCEDLFRERPASSARGRGARDGGDRSIYRIEVAFAGEDARVSLRNNDELSQAELDALVVRLRAYDDRAAVAGKAAWTRQTLALIEEWPARRAPELAELLGRETLDFKADVRKLKSLGLTESLSVGYRLSPRGIRAWNHLKNT